MTTLSKEDVVRAAFDKTFDPDDNGTHWRTFRDGYECGEQAARANLVAENERLKESVRTQESKVLKEQITSLELYQENERLKATPPDQRQDLHCVVSDIAAECRELRDQLTATRTALAAAEARERNYISALKYHADVNCSNILAYDLRDKALAQPRDDSALREMIAGVYEECEQACAEVISRRRENGNTIGFNAMSECKDAIRALAEKAKGE